MKKLSVKRLGKKKAIPSRITNETVAEHRESILAGGRRFKYPMQYARHRLVINTILVAIAALVVIIAIGWWQLYSVQNTSTFFYRVTRLLPLPVASVDGESVRYSNYLMYYNSPAHYLEQNEQLDLTSENGKRQVAYNKRKSIDSAIADAYAAKLAKGLKIKVDNAQIDKVIENDRDTVNGKISQDTYDTAILNILGWSPEENRQATRNKLLLQQVSYAIDTVAAKKRDEAKVLVAQPDADFDKIAATLGGDGSGQVVAGISGVVPRTNHDGGRSAEAAKLTVGQTSGVIKTTTGDGYYFVKLLSQTDRDINYAYLRIPLTKFDEQLAQLKKDGKIKEFIDIPAIEMKQLK